METSHREKTHVLHQIGIGVTAETDAVSNKISLPMTRMILPASREFGQRIPASSLHIDRNMENQCFWTSVSTTALVPLLTVFVAALPVPAQPDFFASVTADRSPSFPRWVSEMSVASKSEVRMQCLGMFTPGSHVALEDIHHTFGEPQPLLLLLLLLFLLLILFFKRGLEEVFHRAGVRSVSCSVRQQRCGEERPWGSHVTDRDCPACASGSVGTPGRFPGSGGFCAR